MKLREVFTYEVEYLLRSPSTWVYAAILFGIAFLTIHAQTENVGALHTNAPDSLVVYSVSIALFGILITAALFGDAAVRDVEVGMDPLLYTSGLDKADYLAGRFLATLVVNAVVLLAIPFGLAAGTVMPYLDPAAFGPFRAAAYLQPWLLFLVPNLVLAGAVLFTVGVLARQVIPVYLAAIGLIVSFLIALQSAGQPESSVLAVLADPVGIRPLIEEQGTRAERNTRLIGFPVGVMANRAVWLAFAAAVLAVLHRRFRFAHHEGGGRREKARVLVEAESERARPLAVPRVGGSFGFRTTVRQTIAIARASIADVVASRWFVIVLLGYVGLTVLFASEDMPDGPFDTSIWPVTLLVVEAILDGPIVVMHFLLIAIYAGELVWKEREVGVAEIADATPVPEGALLLGRFLGLVAMVAMLQAAIMLGGMLFQGREGYYDFEAGLYVRILFGLSLANLVLLAALAMTIHVVVNHKYVGHLVVLMACVAPVLALEAGIVRHHLLLYGSDPGWRVSAMNGFGPFLGPFVWFKLYWAAWAFLLGVAASVLWVRGRETGGMRRRLRQARARFNGPVIRTAGAAIALILVLGGFIFYNTNVLNEYRQSTESGTREAEYEKRYGRFAGVAQPTIAAAGLRIEIYPDEPAVDLRGSYRLENRTGKSIDSVHVVFVDPRVEAHAISFDRAVRPVVVDAEVGYRIYALERPLAPGESLQLAFDVSFRPRGFPNSAIQTDVVANGARVDRSWLPIIGYEPAFGLSDDEARQRFGLAPRAAIPGPREAGERRLRLDRPDRDRVHFETVVGTASDHIAVAYGVLRRSWTENGRRYFHFDTEKPTIFWPTIFSAKYAVVEDRWNDVALQIFHHPKHNYDLDRTMRGMKASLDYYTTHFGPYPDRQLRLIEVPRYGGFGRAHPHTISFTEDYFISRVREGEIDLPFYGTAHEVAHQWWGGQVRGAQVRGHGFLSESLANYSAMTVTAKTYGPEVGRRVYDFQMGRYLAGRPSQGHEVPVLEVQDQPYIAYRKGAIALYMLRDHIGEDRINTALRRYVEKFGVGRGLYPTSLDLYAELRAVTPDSLQYLLTDLFETVTLWDVSTKRAFVDRNGAGEYVVTLDVAAKKLRADSVGNETEVPMNDFVDVGVFAPGEGDAPGEPLYLKRHRIRSGEQTLRITVPRKPGRAGIDPYRRLIDRQRNDNVVEVNPADAERTGSDS